MTPPASGQVFLTVTKGQVIHVADHQALGHVLRRERPLSLEVVPVLHFSDTALQPGCQGIRVGEEFFVGVGSQERSAALEPFGDCDLERVVVAGAAAIPGKADATILGVGTEQLTGENRGLFVGFSPLTVLIPVKGFGTFMMRPAGRFPG